MCVCVRERERERERDRETIHRWSFHLDARWSGDLLRNTSLAVDDNDHANNHRNDCVIRESFMQPRPAHWMLPIYCLIHGRLRFPFIHVSGRLRTITEHNELTVYIGGAVTSRPRVEHNGAAYRTTPIITIICGDYVAAIVSQELSRLCRHYRSTQKIGFDRRKTFTFNGDRPIGSHMNECSLVL